MAAHAQNLQGDTMTALQERGEEYLWSPEFLEVTISVITLLRISLVLLHVLPPQFEKKP